MKSCLFAPVTALVALALIPACSILPPSAGTAPTAKQQQIGNDLQTVADAIRHAENAGFTPAQFNAFLETWVALIPAAVPYIHDAEVTYALISAGGNASALAVEKLAQRYDA